jgi:isopentenyl-diphosphate delta-isomerase
MPDDFDLPSRKADHIRINLEEDVHSSSSTGLDDYYFSNEALPEINLKDVDISQVIFGRSVKAPILISSMTGGTQEAARINYILAEAAQQTGAAMGLGSQRAGIESPELASTYKVRHLAPDVLLFANLGAVQLNYAYTEEQCRRAVDMVEADALILHLNPLQEALQPEGDTLFAGLAQKIEHICKVLPVPVIAKEVGWGISERTARLLASAGIRAIDVAGAGGTSWSQVEKFRIKDEQLANVAASFRGWGIPTAESIIQVKRGAPDTLIFASGGLKSGVDIAKCIGLGASLGGMAGPFLKAAVRSLEITVQTIEEFKREIQICMFATGCVFLQDLRRDRLICKKVA